MRLGLRMQALVIVGALLSSGTPAFAVDIPTNFTFTGSGLGHGVGMSQIGAEGMALEGRSATEILQYFYTGTTVTPVPDELNLRVNLLHQVTSAKIRIEALPPDATPSPTPSPTPTPTSTSTVSPSPTPIIQPAIPTLPTGRIIPADLPADGIPSALPETSFGTADLVTFAATGQGVVATVAGANGTTTLSAPAFTLRWTGTRYLDGPGTLVNLGGRDSSPRYRYGQIHLKSIKSASLGYRLEITNDVRLHDEYLRGIAEVPSSWPAAALQAQVIAARTYALGKVGKIRPECDCALYGHSVDITFAGWAKESEPRWGQFWLAAVAATSPDPGSGLAVLYNGKPITTYFFTSSGGHTQDVGEVWGTPLPWLKPVADPWSVDATLNPKYASWSRSVPQAAVAKAFGLPDVVTLQFPDRTQGGGIKSVVALSSSGQSATLRGEIFRSRLALPSTWLQRPVIRRSGPDEVALAINIGKAKWPTSKSIVLSTFDGDAADAAIAAPLAYAKRALLLLTSGAALDARVSAEIIRRRVTKVYLVGTDISPVLAASLKSLSRLTVVHLVGATRYATATAVAALVPGAPLIVSNPDLPLLGTSIGAIAAARRPILFTTPMTMPWQTARFLATKRSKPTVVGTPASVSDAQIALLSADGRLVDDQRQPTNDDLQRLLVTLFVHGVAGIQVVPAKIDPLLMGGAGIPTFQLTSDGQVSTATAEFVANHPALGAIVVLGDVGLVNSAVFDQLRALR